MKTIDETDRQQSSEEPPGNPRPSVSRRIFVGAAALASAGFIDGDATAQTRAEQLAGRRGNSPSDPGPENKTLLGENPSANTPPFTDHGNPGPI
jgi:oxalate decarboxylase